MKFLRSSVENTLTQSGGKVSLKPGAPVEITVTAEAGFTTILPVSQKASARRVF
jgi:hypothetical protein